MIKKLMAVFLVILLLPINVYGADGNEGQTIKPGDGQVGNWTYGEQEYETKLQNSAASIQILKLGKGTYWSTDPNKDYKILSPALKGNIILTETDYIIFDDPLITSFSNKNKAWFTSDKKTTYALKDLNNAVWTPRTGNSKKVGVEDPKYALASIISGHLNDPVNRKGSISIYPKNYFKKFLPDIAEEIEKAKTPETKWLKEGIEESNNNANLTKTPDFSRDEIIEWQKTSKVDKVTNVSLFEKMFENALIFSTWYKGTGAPSSEVREMFFQYMGYNVDPISGSYIENEYLVIFKKLSPTYTLNEKQDTKGGIIKSELTYGTNLKTVSLGKVIAGGVTNTDGLSKTEESLAEFFSPRIGDYDNVMKKNSKSRFADKKDPRSSASVAALRGAPRDVLVDEYKLYLTPNQTGRKLGPAILGTRLSNGYYWGREVKPVVLYDNNGKVTIKDTAPIFLDSSGKVRTPSTDLKASCAGFQIHSAPPAPQGTPPPPQGVIGDVKLNHALNASWEDNYNPMKKVNNEAPYIDYNNVQVKRDTGEEKSLSQFLYKLVSNIETIHPGGEGGYKFHLIGVQGEISSDGLAASNFKVYKKGGTTGKTLNYHIAFDEKTRDHEYSFSNNDNENKIRGTVNDMLSEVNRFLVGTVASQQFKEQSVLNRYSSKAKQKIILNSKLKLNVSIVPYTKGSIDTDTVECVVRSGKSYSQWSGRALPDELNYGQRSDIPITNEDGKMVVGESVLIDCGVDEDFLKLAKQDKKFEERTVGWSSRPQVLTELVADKTKSDTPDEGLNNGYDVLGGAPTNIGGDVHYKLNIGATPIQINIKAKYIHKETSFNNTYNVEHLVEAWDETETYVDDDPDTKDVVETSTRTIHHSYKFDARGLAYTAKTEIPYWDLIDVSLRVPTSTTLTTTGDAYTDTKEYKNIPILKDGAQIRFDSTSASNSNGDEGRIEIPLRIGDKLFYVTVNFRSMKQHVIHNEPSYSSFRHGNHSGSSEEDVYKFYLDHAGSITTKSDGLQIIVRDSSHNIIFLNNFLVPYSISHPNAYLEKNSGIPHISRMPSNREYKPGSMPNNYSITNDLSDLEHWLSSTQSKALEGPKGSCSADEGGKGEHPLHHHIKSPQMNEDTNIKTEDIYNNDTKNMKNMWRCTDLSNGEILLDERATIPLVGYQGSPKYEDKWKSMAKETTEYYDNNRGRYSSIFLESDFKSTYTYRKPVVIQQNIDLYSNEMQNGMYLLDRSQVGFNGNNPRFKIPNTSTSVADRFEISTSYKDSYKYKFENKIYNEGTPDEYTVNESALFSKHTNIPVGITGKSVNCFWMNPIIIHNPIGITKMHLEGNSSLKPEDDQRYTEGFTKYESEMETTQNKVATERDTYLGSSYTIRWDTEYDSSYYDKDVATASPYGSFKYVNDMEHSGKSISRKLPGGDKTMQSTDKYIDYIATIIPFPIIINTAQGTYTDLGVIYKDVKSGATDEMLARARKDLKPILDKNVSVIISGPSAKELAFTIPYFVGDLKNVVVGNVVIAKNRDLPGGKGTVDISKELDNKVFTTMTQLSYNPKLQLSNKDKKDYTYNSRRDGDSRDKSTKVTAPHWAAQMISFDVIGRIGNLNVDDLEDPNFTETFRDVLKAPDKDNFSSTVYTKGNSIYNTTDKRILQNEENNIYHDTDDKNINKVGLPVNGSHANKEVLSVLGEAKSLPKLGYGFNTNYTTIGLYKDKPHMVLPTYQIGDKQVDIIKNTDNNGTQTIVYGNSAQQLPVSAFDIVKDINSQDVKYNSKETRIGGDKSGVDLSILDNRKSEIIEIGNLRGLMINPSKVSTKNFEKAKYLYRDTRQESDIQYQKSEPTEVSGNQMVPSEKRTNESALNVLRHILYFNMPPKSEFFEESKEKDKPPIKLEGDLTVSMLIYTGMADLNKYAESNSLVKQPLWRLVLEGDSKAKPNYGKNEVPNIDTPPEHPPSIPPVGTNIPPTEIIKYNTDITRSDDLSSFGSH